jgi:hypothetical protein
VGTGELATVAQVRDGLESNNKEEENTESLGTYRSSHALTSSKPPLGLDKGM